MDAIAPYHPFVSGRYEIAPGLSRFGKDFGNGEADRKVFQLDADFGRYRLAKLMVRRECLDRYVCEDSLGEEVRWRVSRFIIKRLAAEHPEHFQRREKGLFCQLTGETLGFDGAGRLVKATPIDPACRDGLDALAMQIQEDIAIIAADRLQGSRLVYLHLCFPNHWAARDKIGKTFAQIHAPVAGIEPINRRADAHVQAMIRATQGWVRFAWGLATDDQLNHHPDVKGRTFDPRNPRAFVRVERQTIWGFPKVAAALFTIRTSFLNCAQIKKHVVHRDALVQAIESMSEPTLEYKGLVSWKTALIEWLKA